MPSSEKQTILIVDDNPRNLQLLGNILRENNYNLEFATSGKEALEWLDEKKFDLVLLDIMMPEMNGYEVCRYIKQDPAMADMPVIFLTARTDKDSLVEGFDAGAQDYISKPFDMKELLLRVRTHLDLKLSREKLQEMNLLLEEKVKERTLELEIANRQLSGLDHAKTEFINLIGHELRTPLNGIIGPMELIRIDYRDEELLKMLGLITESVERLEKFALDALLITNLRTGKQDLNIHPFLLRDLLDELRVRLTPLVEKTNTAIEIDIPGDAIINADYKLIFTCIEKLVEQALMQINDKGTLLFSLCSFEERPELCISDSRRVFTDAFLSSMDELFETGGEYFDTNLGIGMVLVNLILKAHNASISMKNIEGRGASLVLKF